MRARALITKKRVGDWLREKYANSPRSVVGISCSMHNNPLARYANENGYPNARIRSFSWQPTLVSRFIWFPDWACKFVSTINSSGLKQITAQQAVKLLKAA